MFRGEGRRQTTSPAPARSDVVHVCADPFPVSRSRFLVERETRVLVTAREPLEQPDEDMHHLVLAASVDAPVQQNGKLHRRSIKSLSALRRDASSEEDSVHDHRRRHGRMGVTVIRKAAGGRKGDLQPENDLLIVLRML